MSDLWNKYRFEEKPNKSVHEMLKEHFKDLEIETNGVLKMSYSLQDIEHPSGAWGASHITVYVESVKSGVKKKLFMVGEGIYSPKNFPVGIICYPLDEQVEHLNAKELLSKITTWMHHPSIVSLVEKLYNQSV